MTANPVFTRAAVILFQYCNQIVPCYIPEMEVVNSSGKISVDRFIKHNYNVFTVQMGLLICGEVKYEQNNNGCLEGVLAVTGPFLFHCKQAQQEEA